MLLDVTQTVTVPAGATSFTFPYTIETENPYAISVESSPQGLTCSVANGSGTIVASNVDNAVVTCSAQAYPISGTISGLTTAGLALSNGTEILNITAGATSFVLDDVAFGSGYDVVINSQPSGQTCSITGGQGTMPAAAVTDIVVSCTP